MSCFADLSYRFNKARSVKWSGRGRLCLLYIFDSMLIAVPSTFDGRRLYIVSAIRHDMKAARGGQTCSMLEQHIAEHFIRAARHQKYEFIHSR